MCNNVLCYKNMDELKSYLIFAILHILTNSTKIKLFLMVTTEINIMKSKVKQLDNMNDMG
jgi:hypothetical protein